MWAVVPMRVGFVQFKPVFGRKERNIKRILTLLEFGVREGADLLVLPELCTTGYRFKSKEEVRSLSENVPDGMTTETLIRYAEENGLYLVAGVCERSGERYFNSAVLVGPEGFIAKYRKAHLFNEEKLWFTRGDTPFQAYRIAKAKVGMMICFDWFFPEVIRILALEGAQIVCHPSNLVLPYCQSALLGAAVQNRVFIITANRVGSERGLRFTGMSQIIDPNMNVLAKGGRDREEVKVVEINPKLSDSKKVTERNDLWADRRVDLYKPLLKTLR